MTVPRPLTPEEVLGWGRLAVSSPLYAHLAQVIASDPELMRVLNRIEHTPRPNVLFAGVQYLLADEGGELARFYPSLTGDEALHPGTAGPAFRRFVLTHEEELAAIGAGRYTQTNECRRCVALLPAIWDTPLSEFHLLDLGTSAGLNLMLDRYRYHWDGITWGPESTVELHAELRGRLPEPRSITITSRIGLDLNPVDPSDPDQRRWLEALIWPEHHDRRQRLRAALQLASDHDLRLVAGDALATLGPTLDSLPGDEPAVIIHSFALNQFTDDERERVRVILDQARARRPVWRVGMELISWDEEAARLRLDDGLGEREIGRAQPHGSWLELYARP